MTDIIKKYMTINYIYPTVEKEGNKKIYDLNYFFSNISNMEYKNTRKLILGEYIQVRNIIYKKEYNRWDVILLKTRSIGKPVILNINGEIKDIELNENELISEETYIQYYTDSKIIVLQKNLAGVGVTVLQEYIKSFMKDNNVVLNIMKSKCSNFFKKFFIKKYEISIINVEDIVSYLNNSNITDMLKGACKLGQSYTKISGSNGRKKDKKMLLTEEDKNAIEQIADSNNASKVAITILDNNKNEIVCDLIESRIKDVIELQIERGKNIVSERIFSNMFAKYNRNEQIKKIKERI